MTPLEYIRHDYRGSSIADVICDDKACKVSCGPGLIAREVHGCTPYGREMTELEEQKLRASADEHLKKHPSHNVRIIIGHIEEKFNEKKQWATIYEYKAPWSKQK